MRRLAAAGLALIALVGAILTGGRLVGGQATPATDGAMTITVIEHAETDTVIDLEPAGDSLGDLLAFGNPVFDEANATEIGHSQGSCVRTEVGVAWECMWTTVLPDGQIVVEGPFYDAEDSVLAITGGTGEYAGARGEMSLSAREGGTEYEFRFELH